MLTKDLQRRFKTQPGNQNDFTSELLGLLRTQNWNYKSLDSTKVKRITIRKLELLRI